MPMTPRFDDDWDLSQVVDEIADPLDLFDEDVELVDEQELMGLEAEIEDLEAFALSASPAPEAQGRLAMASRVRRVLSGASSTADLEKVSYGKGFFDGLRAAGVSDATAEASFGAIGAMLGATAVKVAAPIVASRLQQRVDAGQPLFPRLKSAMDRTFAPVESDASSLPPVYVSDPEGAEASASLAEPDWLGSGEVVDQFGATCRYGFVERQPRVRAREAAHRAVEAGAAVVQSAPARDPQPFIEDPEATPMLHADGSILDPVYGAMTCVPCPSCARVRMGAVQQGSSQCCICDDYGAILVPKDDVPSLCAARYGVIGATLAILGAAGAAGGAGWALMPEEKKEAVREKIRSRKKAFGRRLAGDPETPVKAKKAAPVEPDEETESTSSDNEAPDEIEDDLAALEASFGAVRALFPAPGPRRN